MLYTKINSKIFKHTKPEVNNEISSRTGQPENKQMKYKKKKNASLVVHVNINTKYKRTINKFNTFLSSPFSN